MGKIHRNRITQKYNNQEIFAFNQSRIKESKFILLLDQPKGEKERKTGKRKKNIKVMFKIQVIKDSNF